MFWRQYANELFAFAYTVKKIIAYERTSIYNLTNWKYRLKNHAQNIVNLDMYDVVKSLGVAINSVQDYSQGLRILFPRFLSGLEINEFS